MLAQRTNSARTGNEADIKPIGIYVSRSDENLDPLLSEEDDMIASSPFEPAIDGLLFTILILVLTSNSFH